MSDVVPQRDEAHLAPASGSLPAATGAATTEPGRWSRVAWLGLVVAIGAAAAVIIARTYIDSEREHGCGYWSDSTVMAMFTAIGIVAIAVVAIVMLIPTLSRRLGCSLLLGDVSTVVGLWLIATLGLFPSPC